MNTGRHSAPPPALYKTAPATAAIAALCVLIWLVEQFAFQNFIGYGMAMIPARLMSGLPLGMPGVPAVLTPITMTFVHAGLAHLLLNMVFLIFIGRFVEPLLGSGRYLALYFASGIVGALLEAVLSPDSIVPYVGASGAISGVFAAHAMIFGRRDPSSSEGRRALQLAAVWIGLQVALGLVFNGGGGGGIAIWAHVGGFLTGLVLALPLARDAIRTRR
ncbi:rhomboid family intramembrane serine protease [Pacificimonas flava]|uniref:Rhomboid family serine protease n=1 Tax=Pacificimonas flava TaxID=1234595 RepID=M2U3N7_9SPHN|nr:rhomboid family intramembrane serine protease [Pacificimonas flava]EMD82573.1 rhomboid family serine protease [Pacificimonas flava]MBB5281401.1 membrane associated rhomboid family serine protease [Pacificimonas flava]